MFGNGGSLVLMNNFDNWWIQLGLWKCKGQVSAPAAMREG
jgi:hypothetical protein